MSFYIQYFKAFNTVFFIYIYNVCVCLCVHVVCMCVCGDSVVVENIWACFSQALREPWERLFSFPVSFLIWKLGS